MIIFGLLLIVAAVVAGTFLFIASQDLSQATDLTAWGVTVGLTPLVMLITGGGLMLALLVGLSLIRGGIARGNRQRRERKDLEKTAEQNRLAAEQEAARRLERERSVTDPAPGGSTAGGWQPTDPGRDVPPPPRR